MQDTTNGSRRGGARESGPALSNYVADLAERAGAAYRRGRALSQEAAESYLEAGGLLCELKAAAGHGAWTAALARTQIPGRTARRMMRLSQAGLDAAEIVEAGGVKAAEAGLSESPKMATGANLAGAAGALEGEASSARAPSGTGAGGVVGARMTEAERARARRARLREAGLCTTCGVNPTDGRSRCSACAEVQAAAAAARAARARLGAAVEPRLRRALEAGHGARLSAAEVKAAFAASPARRGRRSP